MYQCFHKNIKQRNIDENRLNVWAPNHHIRMISEGSCDTEDWSIDVTITGINYILKYI